MFVGEMIELEIHSCATTNAVLYSSKEYWWMHKAFIKYCSENDRHWSQRSLPKPFINRGQSYSCDREAGRLPPTNRSSLAWLIMWQWNLRTANVRECTQVHLCSATDSNADLNIFMRKLHDKSRMGVTFQHKGRSLCNISMPY